MSGPFTYSLNAAAAYVLRSLMEHPGRGTPNEIADESIDAGGVRDALGDLARHGLAEQAADGRWHVTDSGRAVGS
jgi:predicted transcriptional regulator